MKLNVLFVLLISSLTVCSVQAVDRCTAFYRKTIDPTININATTSQDNYRQMNIRNLSAYENLLGPAFDKSISLLQQNDLFVDVGAGYGSAGLELMSRKSGVRVVAINTQNAWAFVEKIPAAGTDQNVSPAFEPWAKQNEIYEQIINKIGGEKNALRLAFAMGVPHEAFQHTHGMSQGPDGYDRPYFTPGFARDVLEHIHDFYHTKKMSGFSYQVGFAENILSSLNGKAKVIADVFGAYYYSIDRPSLISNYYAGLKPGGEGYVIIESKDFHRAGPETHGPKTLIKGTNQSFEEYLCATYPSIFSIHTHERRGLADSNVKYLKINKKMSNDELRINFTVTEYSFNSNEPVPLQRQIPFVIVQPE